MNNIFMSFILLISFVYVYSEIVKETDTTSQTTTAKTPAKETVQELKNLNTNLNSLWLYRPIPYIPQISHESEAHRFILRTPRLVTKLAKTYSFGFDPYFSKGYFEPFENRPKPVTLVAFRKNGLVPKRIIKFADDKSFEIAELQSPYNQISNFWTNQPGEVQPNPEESVKHTDEMRSYPYYFFDSFGAVFVQFMGHLDV